MCADIFGYFGMALSAIGAIALLIGGGIWQQILGDGWHKWVWQKFEGEKGVRYSTIGMTCLFLGFVFLVIAGSCSLSRLFS